MKSFVISIITLILVFVVIIWNFFYINNIYVNMTDAIKDLKPDVPSSIKVKEIYNYWKSKSVFIALSVPHRISDEIEKNLIILMGRILESSNIGFEEARLLALNSIEEMKVHAGISADSIF